MLLAHRLFGFGFRGATYCRSLRTHATCCCWWCAWSALVPTLVAAVVLHSDLIAPPELPVFVATRGLDEEHDNSSDDDDAG